MKKTIVLILTLVSALTAGAQNIQLHYDFGRNIYSGEEAGRAKATITLEQFKADQWGSWFYFVDLDLSRNFMESAYTEISREFNFEKESPFAAHFEYDGGLNRFGSFQQAALVGAAYNGHTADFSKTWSVQLMYKHFFKSYEYTNAYESAQLTGVWGMNCRRASLSTRQINALESSRCLISYTRFTASALVASQPIPHTVSVG